MNKSVNFWEEMKKPIFCLAPMADVTDAAFRQIICICSKSRKTFSSLSTHKSLLAFSSARLSQPAQGTLGKVFRDFVTYTEFVSADGLVLAPNEGKKKLLKNLEYSEIERPIVAQLFTSRPEMMEKVAELVTELGFDGIDINMGCPDKNIQKQCAGAALMKNPKLAREIIAAAKIGIKKAAEKLNKKEIPLSVKTRLGYSKDELETWLPEILAENPAAVIVHARTKKEMSKVPANWERIKRAVEIRDELQNFSTPQPQKCTDIFLLKNSSCSRQSRSQGISAVVVPKNLEKTLIIGNGDVKDIADAKNKCEETGADGVMIGRAIFGNPWLFAGYEPTNEERLKVLLEHIKLFDEKFAGVKSFDIMKKHFREYLKGPELRDLKYKLMRAENAKEAEKIIKNYF
jgi:tRNA-dihydrouridine synthase